jgi:hypothetical protein
LGSYAVGLAVLGWLLRQDAAAIALKIARRISIFMVSYPNRYPAPECRGDVDIEIYDFPLEPDASYVPKMSK